MKKILKTVGLYLSTFLLGMLLFVGLMMILALIQEKLIIGEGFNIWLIRGSYININLVVEVIFFLSTYNFLKTKFNKKEDGKFIHKIIGKYYKTFIFSLILIIGVFLYAFLINVVSLKGDNIKVFGTFSPFGKEYTFQDIKQIDVGFYEKRKFFSNNKGEFYYIVTLNDGTNFNLNDIGGEGNMYDESETFLSIEEFDKAVLINNTDITKNAAMDNYEYSHLDKKYINRFKRIIENN